MVAISPSLSSWAIPHPSLLSPLPPSPSSLPVACKCRTLLVRAELSPHDDGPRKAEHITILASPNNNNNKSSSSSPLLPPEDVGYVIKVTLGSVGGAMAIKYGSLLLPDITRPNVSEALVIVALPVVVAMALLTISSLRGKGK